MPLTPARRRAGFTLIEVMVATALLTLGLGTASMLMAGAFGTYRAQNRTLEINHLVHDQMETLTSTPYETLASDIKRARRDADPTRDELPPQRDFVMGGSENGVTAAYEMVPPPDGRDDYSVKRPTPGGPAGANVTEGGKRNRNVAISMHLEYWDPVFDKPVATDQGLIRAAYEIKWDGVSDHGVKYVAR